MGSDVNLGSRLLNDAWSDGFDIAAVLTNDSDLTAPIRFSVARKKTVLIIHPDNHPARSLTNSATGSLHWHDKHLRDSQLPAEITLANGKVVRKPLGFYALANRKAARRSSRVAFAADAAGAHRRVQACSRSGYENCYLFHSCLRTVCRGWRLI